MIRNEVAVSCRCSACTLGCEPHECQLLPPAPTDIYTITAAWATAHRRRSVLDAADAALDLGLVGLGFTGADLLAISTELVLHVRQRMSEPLPAVVTYSRSGERMGARCPRCLSPADGHGCGVELRREPLSLEMALSMSLAEPSNDERGAP